MNEATAQLNSYRQSPRKVRVVADAVRGKSITDGRNILTFLTKRATGSLHKLLNSAVANAKNIGLDEKSLFIKTITVDKGQIMYRRRPVAHGAAHPIRKKTSHIKIVLETRVAKAKK
jgi:large subunit ribosomal protein L22